MIDKESLKQLIVFYIKDTGGCKLTDLITDFPSKQVNYEVLIAMGDFDMRSLSQELHKEGRISMIQYVVPSDEIIQDNSEDEMKTRARAFLLPKGSMVWDPQDN